MLIQQINTALLFCWLGIEVILSIRKRSAANSADKSSLRLIWLILIACIFIGNWLSQLHLMSFTSMQLVQGFALALLVCGFIIRYTAIYTLKQHFTFNVAIAKDHELIQAGLYQWIRHPGYLGSLLIIAALGLQFGNWLSFFIIVIPAIAVHIYRINIEETALANHFGLQYSQYKAKTWRLLPWVY
jgi:protein-S-isoprenylcysteine O-methyltransferase Ste14